MKLLSTPKPLCSSKKSPKTIALITGTRAEWGLLYPLAKALDTSAIFTLNLIVTGAHLCKALGDTYKEIQSDGFHITHKIPILDDLGTNALNSAQSIANAIVAFSEYFAQNTPDMVVLLGDRYEAFGVAIAAANLNIPIAHINGGESTQGANDEYMRHCISKMSYLHFPSTELYAKRIIQLGEDPKRVFNVGSLAVENIHNTPLLPKPTLAKKLHINEAFLDKFCVLTFHPTTLESTNPAKEITLLIQALLQSDYNILATKANADAGGWAINDLLSLYAKTYSKRLVLCASLGRVMYLSALKCASFVIGNSSSGLSEAPILKVPTINIGNRQKGRYMPDSVLCINPNLHNKKRYMQEVLDGIATLQSPSYQSTLSHPHPFGEGKSAEKITKVLEDTFQYGEINLQKAFYDIH